MTCRLRGNRPHRDARASRIVSAAETRDTTTPPEPSANGQREPPPRTICSAARSKQAPDKSPSTPSTDQPDNWSSTTGHPQPTPTYLYYDAHGNQAAQLIGTATTPGSQDIFRYDPFGAPTPAPTGTSTVTRYVGAYGKNLDPTSGLIEMGARPYDPTTGRFIAVDPVDGGSLNNYDYAGQDPLNRYDLTGKMLALPDPPGLDKNTITVPVKGGNPITVTTTFHQVSPTEVTWLSVSTWVTPTGVTEKWQTSGKQQYLPPGKGPTWKCLASTAVTVGAAGSLVLDPPAGLAAALGWGSLGGGTALTVWECH
jgi:RHS repeat-associated protein